MKGKEMSDTDDTFMGFSLKCCVNIHKLSPNGTVIRLEADEDMRLQLAQNHDLVRVDYFVGDFQLTPSQQGQIILSGCIRANIVQRCVVSADALSVKIETPVEVQFIPQESRTQPDNQKGIGQKGIGQKGIEALADFEQEIDFEQENDIEFFSGNILDIGALAEEFFALALNPYPRKEGAEFFYPSNGQAEQENSASASPFAILAKLK